MIFLLQKVQGRLYSTIMTGRRTEPLVLIHISNSNASSLHDVNLMMKTIYGLRSMDNLKTLREQTNSLELIQIVENKLV